MNLEQVILQLSKRLDDAGLAFGHNTADAWEEAALIALYSLGVDPPEDEGHDVEWSRILTEDELQRVDAVATRRIAERVPLAYLVNQTWFGGRQFYIDERAIIPRSYLVEWLPDAFAPWIDPKSVHSVLDLCTGSGCLAISCALEFPDASITASDISGDALEVARRNVERYGLEDRVSLVRGDGLDAVTGKFDMIICNPPYVSDVRMDALPAEFRCEPDKAFRGGLDGLDFIVPMLSRAADYMTGRATIFVD